MKNLFVAAAAAAVLYGSAVFADPVTENHRTPEAQMDYACEYVDSFYDVKCGDLEAPLVVISKTVMPWYYGYYYHGEPYVFVNAGISDRQQAITVIHETVHYILHESAEGEFARCESEEVARRVHNLWAGTEYNDNWREGYKC